MLVVVDAAEPNCPEENEVQQDPHQVHAVAQLAPEAVPAVADRVRMIRRSAVSALCRHLTMVAALAQPRHGVQPSGWAKHLKTLNFKHVWTFGHFTHLDMLPAAEACHDARLLVQAKEGCIAAAYVARPQQVDDDVRADHRGCSGMA